MRESAKRSIFMISERSLRTILLLSVPIPRHFINSKRTRRPETNYAQGFSTTNMAFILVVLPTIINQIKRLLSGQRFLTELAR